MITCKYLVKNPEGFKGLVDFLHKHYKVEPNNSFTLEEDFPESYPCIYVMGYSTEGVFEWYDTVELSEFVTSSDGSNSTNIVCV